jgi:endonuclease YncB( thermonuclease family)
MSRHPCLATVEGRDVDRYGRLVARVSVRGDDAGTALLLAGLACHFTAYSSDVALANATRDDVRAEHLSASVDGRTLCDKALVRHQVHF